MNFGTVLVVCVLFILNGQNFKAVLFFGCLCSANEHNISIDLNRFQVVSEGHKASLRKGCSHR